MILHFLESISPFLFYSTIFLPFHFGYIAVGKEICDVNVHVLNKDVEKILCIYGPFVSIHVYFLFFNLW